MKTDGYVQGNEDDIWKYTNVRDRAGPNPSSSADAYIRVEKDGAPEAGITVSSTGAVGEGPAVAFMSPDELLGSVPGDSIATASSLAEAQASLSIKWAGIHPGSLREVLIVWSQDIVLLNRSKILLSGGAGGSVEGVGVAGRLMTIALAEPVAIDGIEEANITIQAGALGCYVNYSGDCPTGVQTGVGDGNGGAGAGNAVLDGLLFCDASCFNQPESSVPDTDATTGLGFVVNGGMQGFGVKCTYPFELKAAEIKCNGNSEPAPVWLVCYVLYGSTSPVRTLPLSKLMDLPSDIDDWQKGEIYGAITSDVDCGGTVTAQIVGTSGNLVSISGIWRGGLPGYEGQTVQIVYKGATACGQACQTVLVPQDAECWVEEDIAKPAMRTIPVGCIVTQGLTATTITIPTSYISQTLTLPTFLESRQFTFISTYTLTDITALINIPADALWVRGVDYININVVDTLTPVANVLTGSVSTVVTGCDGTNINVCDEMGGIVSIFVVTECLTADVTPVSINNLTTKVTEVVQSITTQAVETDVIRDVPADFRDLITSIALYQDLEVTILLPDGEPDEIEVAIFDDASPLQFLRQPTTEEDADIKYLKKPPKATGSGTLWLPLPGCGSRYFCFPQGVDSPESDDDVCEDASIILFSPLWTNNSIVAENCPCYADCEELPCSGPGPGQDEPPTGINPCTIRVNRMQRNWCKSCNVS